MSSNPLVLIDGDTIGRGRTGDETYTVNLLRELPAAAPELTFAASLRNPADLPSDVPAAVRANLGTLPPGPAWAVAGLSEGGSCAIMLALRHPGLFATFGDFSGLAGPRVGETNDDTADTVAQLFGGSQQAFAAHEPADLLATGRFPHTGGWFEVGDLDDEPLAAAQQLVPLATAAGIATCLVVVPDGDHTFDLWSAAFRQSLPWTAQRLGLVAVSPTATAPCQPL